MAISENVESVYQFKISLRHYKPKIWRRILVPGNYTFASLHEAIKRSMGWGGCRLHQFYVKHPKHGKTCTIEMDEKDVVISTLAEGTFGQIFTKVGQQINENDAKIADYFIVGRKAIYEYDFQDHWQHIVTLEAISPAVEGEIYPRCIDGKLACPPEDVGGVEGYEEFVKILKNPSHKNGRGKIKWLRNVKLLESNFNPEKFDPAAISLNLEKTHEDIKIFKLKITLRYYRPKIWRKILVPSNYTFARLHPVIYQSMGWEGYHLHQFFIKHPQTNATCTIGINENEAGIMGYNLAEWYFCQMRAVDGPRIHEKNAKISDYFTSVGKQGLYEYDFGDCWEHIVTLEEILPVVKGEIYPRCVEGRRACPPEDCGGVRQYPELLKILKNPLHPEHKEQKDWLRDCRGTDEFDPEKFDASDIDLNEISDHVMQQYLSFRLNKTHIFNELMAQVG